MDQDVIATHLKNLDHRLSRVEQILPTLATKNDLTAFATKEDVAEAIAPLASKEDVAEAVAPLANRKELNDLAADLRGEIREEGERSRLYMKILIEQQDGKLDLLAEHVLSLMPKEPER